MEYEEQRERVEQKHKADRGNDERSWSKKSGMQGFQFYVLLRV